MRISKAFRIFAISLLATITLIAVSSAILSMFYEKAVIRYMKKYLDEHLLTELSMDEIRFRLLKGFPNATVEITNAVVLSGEGFNNRDFAGTFSDTLLQANSVLFQFDLMKLFNKKYELKKIEVSQGRANILFDSKNRHNLNIWRSPEKATQKYSIKLRGITLNDITLKLISLREQIMIDAISEKTNFKGTFSGNVLSGETRGSFSIQNLAVKNNSIVRNASLRLTLKMVYSGNRFRVSQGRIQLNKAIASLKGEFKGGKDNYIDLSLNIPKFGLDELMSLIPPDKKPKTGNYEFTGDGKLKALIKGPLSSRNGMLISSDFELNNCTALNTDSKTSVGNINLKGSIAGTRFGNFSLELEKFNSTLGKGTIDGTFALRNNETRQFRADVHGNIDLEALKNFAGLDTIQNLTGFVNSDFTAAGDLKKLSGDSTTTLLDFLEKGTFIFRDAGIRLKRFPVSVEHISGKATWDKIVRLDSISLVFNETAFLINGQLHQVTGYLHNRELLKSNLEITTDNLDISKYLNRPSGSKSSGGYKSLSIFPSNIYLKVLLKAKSFTAGKFKASDLTLNMSSLKDSVYIDNFFLNFPDGSIAGNALITIDSKNMFSITCNAKPQTINIQQLFTSFNNFTQHFIIDKNVRGKLNGTLSFYAQWDSTLKFIPKSMKAKGDFEITNGELVQFEPMLRLSKYIDVEELRHIRFKTLKNSIFISDRLVTIPEMALHSTAFNISVSGQHSFDNEFDYRLRVLLSEVLFNKARKKKREIDEFLVEETRGDQTTIPLIIAGTPNKFDVRFDKKKAFNLTRSNIKDEPGQVENKPSSKNFKIEWEEPEEKIKDNKPATKNDPSDFVIEWDEEDDPENK